MSIKKQYLIPEFYIQKIPICDDCNIPLIDLQCQLLSSPPKAMYKCKKCNKNYNFNVNDIQGEWKWRTI